MAHPEQLEELVKGAGNWNTWRASLTRGDWWRTPWIHFRARPNNDSAYILTHINIDLTDADLSGLDLRGANLSDVDLRRANLRGARLDYGRFQVADLRHADLTNAILDNADLSGTELSDAILNGASLRGANLHSAGLERTDLEGAIFSRTCISDVDLSTARGLSAIHHAGPSHIDVETLIASKGLPEVFLRGCGAPDRLIDYIESLITAPIQYYSCFISYSTKDQSFAERLHNDLQAKGVRCWFAPHDAQAGQKLHEQIDTAIRVYDKLLLILSVNSINSEWVKTEIYKARKREAEQNRRMLFPVRLVAFRELQDWECFDADTGKDSAREIREYYIPDFSNWATNTDQYWLEIEKLLRDLKA